MTKQLFQPNNTIIQETMNKAGFLYSTDSDINIMWTRTPFMQVMYAFVGWYQKLNYEHKLL
jgi:hypothetical protein